MSCPGFGGTRLKNPGQATVDSVSSTSYSKLLSICNSLFTPKVIVGHSAGGEASLQYSFQQPIEGEKKVPVVALHPAVSLKNQGIFRTISNLDATNRFFRQLLVFTPVVSAIENQILSWLVGADTKSDATKWQLALHKDEAERNTVAYRLKNRELELPDDPARFEQYSMQLLPTVLLGEADRLTTEMNARSFLPVIRQLLLERIGKETSLIVTSEDQLKLLAKTVGTSIVSGNWGHDAVFFDEVAQEAAATLIVNQLEMSLLKDSWYFQELKNICVLLRQQGFPLEFCLYSDIREEHANFEKNMALLLEHVRDDQDFVRRVFTSEKDSLRYELEQRYIMVSWMQVFRQLIGMAGVVTERINGGGADRTAKAELERMLVEIATMMTKFPSVELYLHAMGKEYKNENIIESIELLLELLFNQEDDPEKPKTIPRAFFESESQRFSFKNGFAAY